MNPNRKLQRVRLAGGAVTCQPIEVTRLGRCPVSAISWSRVFNWLARNAFLAEDRRVGEVVIRCECCPQHWTRLTDDGNKGRASARADRRAAAVHVIRYHGNRVCQVDNALLLRAQAASASILQPAAVANA